MPQQNERRFSDLDSSLDFGIHPLLDDKMSLTLNSDMWKFFKAPQGKRIYKIKMSENENIYNFKSQRYNLSACISKFS